MKKLKLEKFTKKNYGMGSPGKKRAPKMMSFRNKSLVYYGVHPCQRCDKDGKNGTAIVKAGNGASEKFEFDFVHDSYYPNHVWKKHKCIK